MKFRNPRLSSLRMIPSLFLEKTNEVFKATFGFYQAFGSVHFFSLGREALREALKKIAREGQVVHLPAFICKEVTDAVRESGYEIQYYPLNRSLEPSPLLLNLDLTGQIILVVHYFGFPTAIESIAALKHAGAIVIEDNAHGIFSESKGHPLGTNADYGVFSFRKTLGLHEGSFLLDRTADSASCDQHQTKWVSMRSLKAVVIREAQQKLGWSIWSAYRNFIRNVSSVQVPQVPQSPQSPKMSAAPRKENKSAASYRPSLLDLLLLKTLKMRAKEGQVQKAYASALDTVTSHGFQPVFKELPVGVLPLGVPIWVKNIDQDKQRLEDLGFESYRWPELPSEVLESPELQSMLPLNGVLILPYQ